MASNVNLMESDGGGGGYSSRQATSAALASSRRRKKYNWEAYMRQQQKENMMASGSASGNFYDESGDAYGGDYDGDYYDDGDYYEGDDEGYYEGGGGGFDWAAYYAELQRQAQERADAAYERNMERIASAYDSAYGSLKGNYDSTASRLNEARDKSKSEVSSDAEKSLQEAYINNMLTKKNLNQRLSAMGYNGGATETTMAQLANNYGTSRTGINETLNKNLANLNSTYGDNLASALQSFNSAKANLDLQRMQLEMQAENARNNAIESSMSANFGMDSSYLSALQAALSSQSGYAYNPSAATNSYVAGNAKQAQAVSQGNNYAKWMAQQLLGGGNNTTDVSKYLLSKGYNVQTINDILKQLGAT